MLKSLFVAVAALFAIAVHADDILVDCIEFWDERCFFDAKKEQYNCQNQGVFNSWKRSQTEAFKITLKRRSNGSVYVEKIPFKPGVTTRTQIVFDSNPSPMKCLNYDDQWDCESNDRGLAIKAMLEYGPLGLGMDISSRRALTTERLAHITNSVLCLVNGQQLP